jgi:hypothetical protein
MKKVVVSESSRLPIFVVQGQQVANILFEIIHRMG